MADDANRTRPLPHRATSAIVLSRPVVRLSGTAGSPRRRPDASVTHPAWRWGVIATWIVLGATIAALWALLLLGDSLAPPENAASSPLPTGHRTV